MKRTFKQEVRNKNGAFVASRELTFDVEPEHYNRPTFVAHIIETEEEFLKELFTVTTKEEPRA